MDSNQYNFSPGTAEGSSLELTLVYNIFYMKEGGNVPPLPKTLSQESSARLPLPLIFLEAGAFTDLVTNIDPQLVSTGESEQLEPNESLAILSANPCLGVVAFVQEGKTVTTHVMHSMGEELTGDFGFSQEEVIQKAFGGIAGSGDVVTRNKFRALLAQTHIRLIEPEANLYNPTFEVVVVGDLIKGADLKDIKKGVYYSYVPKESY